MEFYQYAKAEFQGPGGIVVTLMELCFNELIPEELTGNFPVIWNQLKESSLLNIGTHQGNTSFGPFIRQKITDEDFTFVSWEESVQLIDGFITAIPEFYFRSWHKSIDRDIIKKELC